MILSLVLTICVSWVTVSLATFNMENVSPVVSTSLGKVRGSVDYSRLSRRYYQYLGIPYAEPPVGELRFEAPVPLKTPAWEGIFEATRWGPPCLQFDAILKGRVMGQEDCLVLNVFTRSTDPGKLQPVLVWVHGGGFVAGSSDMYDPKYLMDHDIVFVSMNYRLAALGFLNTGDELIRGNMGLKDENLVLHFIKDNIRNFGGDPGQVTLFGESAGAAAVHYHVVSPLSKGLFHRAVMQSGNIFCPWAFTRNPRKQAVRFGNSLGCPTENTKVLVNCLKKMDGSRIVKQHANILSPVHTQDDFFPGSVEHVLRNDTFLHDNPFKLISRGEFNKVPVIFGVNSGEGALKTARIEATPEVLYTLDTHWEEYVAILLHFDPKLKSVSDKVRQFYFPQSVNTVLLHKTNETSSSIGLKPRIRPQEYLQNITEMVSDAIWFQPTSHAAKEHAKFARTYLNYFSYHSDILPSTYTFIKAAREMSTLFPVELTWPAYFAESFWNQMFFQDRSHKRFGACHGDDLYYYFSYNPLVQIRPSSGDYPFSRDFVQFLIDFSYGTSHLKFGDIPWDSIRNISHLRYMRLDHNPEMIDQPFSERVDFIESLGIRDPLDLNNW